MIRLGVCVMKRWLMCACVCVGTCVNMIHTKNEIAQDENNAKCDCDDYERC